MPSSYPSGLDALQRVAAGDSMQSTSHSGLHNSQSDAIEAIQTVLGLSPQGGSATVGARCAALESGKASLSDLAGKAASVHSHAQSDVTGLDTALSGKASTTHASTHAPAGSDPLTVAQSQVTGLPADLAARVTGPASSTDNTLPRFDLATGKVLQGSGVTVDDSNNISGLGTVAGTGLSGSLLSSASPVMNGAASAGTAVVPSRQDHVHPSDTSRAALSGATFTGDVVVGKATGTISNSGSGLTRIIASSSDGSARVEARTVSGQSSAFMLSTGSLPRWTVQKGTGAESGSNAGADLQVVAYDDAGAQLSVPVTFARASGKTTFGSVGASAGLEYGTSGPRDMVGTGSPEGVVTAPVGSTWRDTAATTGAIKWIKASGSGNTGWKVEYGDTGRRTGFSLQSGFVVASSVNYLSRSAGIVQYQAILQKSAGNYVANDIPVIIPDGFRPASAFYQYAAGLNNGTQININIPTNGEVTIAGNASAAYLYLNLTFRTEQPWPSTLPGTAA